MQKSNVICGTHSLPVTHICKSPYCDYFKLLCPRCKTEDDSHQMWHIETSKAMEDTKLMLIKVLSELQAIKAKKRDEMKMNIDNNPGLTQINDNLKAIRQLVNDKIDKFHEGIRRMYNSLVRQKLDELENVVEKSQRFLENERGKLTSVIDLRPFFLNDFEHELKYYKSYFQEIYTKNIRDFKTALDNDSVLTLIMNFEQNLQKIFTINKPATPVDRKHIFTSTDGMIRKTELIVEGEQTIEEEVEFHWNLPPQLSDYGWDGHPQSIYYHPKDCYYIFGQGRRLSKRIVKFEQFRADRQQPRQSEGILTLLSNLDTQRTHFATCLLNGQIYIVGGVNNREGCLVKCQKFIPVYNKVYIIASLNNRSCGHSLVSFKNKFILKFGGTDQLPETVGHKQILPELYSLDTEEWAVIGFDTRNLQLNFGIQPSLFVHSNSIVIFGGNWNFSSNIPLVKPVYAVEIRLSKKEQQINQFKIRQVLYPVSLPIVNATIQETSSNKFAFLMVHPRDERHIQAKMISF